MIVEQHERDENRANRQRFADRIQELEARRNEIHDTLAEIAVAAAMGDKRSIVSEREAKAESDAISGQIDTLRRAIERLDAEYDHDAPARAAELAATRQAGAAKIALEIIENDREIDRCLRTIVSGFVKRAELAKALGEFGEVVDRLPQDAGAIVKRLLGNAGLDKISPDFMRSAEPPHTLAEVDAETLRSVLPADDVDVRRMTRFRAQKHEEYRRLNSPALPEPRRYHPPGL